MAIKVMIIEEHNDDEFRRRLEQWLREGFKVESVVLKEAAGATHNKALLIHYGGDKNEDKQV